MAPEASSGTAQKDRQAGRCGMESVPGILMVAATALAGLRVVEVGTTTACHARTQGRNQHRLVCGSGYSRKRANVGLPREL